jgi:RecB family exonuclease
VVDRAALSAIAGVLGSLDEDDAPTDEGPPRPRGPLPPGELGRLLADLTFADESGPPDGLALLDYATVRARRFRLVVLCGLDGVGYPTGPAADALLGPLRAPLAARLLPRAPGTSESRLRFMHAASAATERLVLVRRVVDDDGRELAPSPYWVEACRVLRRDPEAMDRRSGARGEVVDEVDGAPTRHEALRLLASKRHSVPGELEAALGRRTRRRGLAPGALEHLAAFRVTELEGFLRCPYGWLSGSYLHPEPLEPPFDAAFEGTLGHKVLEALYSRMAAQGVGPCTPTARPRYAEALPEVLGEAAAELRPEGAGPEYEIYCERLRVHLLALLAAEAELRPAMTPTRFEWQVADDDLLGLAPPARLTGTVDRVDVSAGGDALVVIDYKRSGAKLRRSEAVVDRLQLPLYGLMASRALPGSRPAGGLYVGFLTGGRHGAISDEVDYCAAELPRTIRIEDDEWRGMVEDAVEAARQAAADIRAGRLAGPPSKGCPPWCGCGDLWR